ncbi:alpha-ketoglutarate-dependent dioxygenase alkB homolog 7, mitochondrial isoform X3 [Orcinus orca]|uniref:alpha-ketoglutarate-dependent dioxygenase alkB homolog 7, mitochondrial isoform X3 n=1 Tax=Orcinus orca TaxID=9733 RepID=UPI00211195E8|nr:alpha-ketoglutarate-dependent dioxygenase alkB homolog 7, mitochondrial isoform X3 [Orcinus orca]
MAGSGRLALWSVTGQGWVRGSGPAVLSRLRDAAVVRPGFLSAAEEETLSSELEPQLRRRRYELDLSSLGRPSTASERQRSRAGQRQAGRSCSVCRQPPLAPARPCSPRCTCWTWNLGGTSSHMWTASRGSARYDFSHEILRDEESFFGERRVPRGRRISVICRSLPEGMGPGEPGQVPPPC